MLPLSINKLKQVSPPLLLKQLQSYFLQIKWFTSPPTNVFFAISVQINCSFLIKLIAKIRYILARIYHKSYTNFLKLNWIYKCITIDIINDDVDKWQLIFVNKLTPKCISGRPNYNDMSTIDKHKNWGATSTLQCVSTSRV